MKNVWVFKHVRNDKFNCRVWDNLCDWMTINIRFQKFRINSVNCQLTTLSYKSRLFVLSRASAAALCTVLRTTSLSEGNIRLLGVRQTETPWPIKTKSCTIDYVGKITKYAKNGWNRFSGGCSPYTWNILTILYFTLPYLTFFFLERSYRSDGSTDFHARYLKQRGLFQGSAFRGSQ